MPAGCPLAPGDEELLRTALLRALQGAPTHELKDVLGPSVTHDQLPAVLDAMYDRMHYIAQVWRGCAYNTCNIYIALICTYLTRS
jgi:hypothetical protein